MDIEQSINPQKVTEAKNKSLTPTSTRPENPGGDERIRTADLRVANAALSQLSYIPTKAV